MKFHQDGIYRLGVLCLERRAGQYNETHFPTDAFPANYGLRMKSADMEVLKRVWRSKVRQIWQGYRQGERMFDNIVFVNTRHPRSGKPDRTFNHKLAKGVRCGLVQGEAVTAEELEYANQYSVPGAKGVGFKAWKRWHGPKKDFEIALAPKVFPLEAFPPDIVWAWQGDLARKTRLSLAKTNNLTKESIREADAASESEAEQARKVVAALMGQPSLADKLTEDLAGANDGKRREVKQISGEAIVQDQLRQSLVRKLHLAGKEAEAAGVLLMQAYLRHLAPAMHMRLVPTEVERGYLMALKLFEGLSSAQIASSTNRYLEVIRHMAQWLSRTGKYVPIPSIWFDLNSGSHILGAERLFLRPYEQKAEAFAETRAIRQEATAQSEQYDRQQGAKSPWHTLALRLKKGFRRQHPHDFRLALADLDLWSGKLRRLEGREIPLAEVEQVVNWLFQTESYQADFWRKRSGIRSAAGFVRQYSRFFQAMQADPRYGLHKTHTYTGR